MPRCELCTVFIILALMDFGTTTLSPRKTNPSCVHNSSWIWKYGMRTESLFSGHPFMIVSFKAHNTSSSVPCLRSFLANWQERHHVDLCKFLLIFGDSWQIWAWQQVSYRHIRASLPPNLSIVFQNSQEHALKMFWGTMKWFLHNSFEGLMVIEYNNFPSKHVLMELGQTEHHGQSLFFFLSVCLLSVSQLPDGVRNRMTLLQQYCTKTFLACVALQD